MSSIFSNPKCGTTVALIHIFACTVISIIIVLELNRYLDDDTSVRLFLDSEKWLEKMIATSVALLFLCLLMIILCFLLICGIWRQTHHFMAPWLGLTFACTVASFMFSLVAICSSFINLLSFKDNVFKISCGVASLVFHVGIFYPIFVLYKDILVIRLKKEGLYEGESISFDDELVDENETYHL